VEACFFDAFRDAAAVDSQIRWFSDSANKSPRADDIRELGRALRAKLDNISKVQLYCRRESEFLWGNFFDGHTKT
jgi:hypothetical protein